MLKGNCNRDNCQWKRDERPSDLPVMQAAKFDRVVNLKTAKAFCVNLPLPLLGRADEIIE